MSSKNKSQLRIENNASFPNNNTGFITPDKLRTYNENIIDSMVSNEDSASFGGGAATASLLESASFNNGTRLMTFTKGDASTFDVSIPDSTLDSGSFISTASISDATITFTKGDSQTFSIEVNNVSSSISASHAVNSLSASHAEQADNATSASQAVSSSVVSDPNIAYINKDNTFTGTQSFTNISVAGTGSFGRIEAVTGSAKIIGDAFVVVNADTPALKYAGLKVFDSGSGATASFEWDGDEDSWILVEEGGQSAFVLTGPTGSKGSEVNLSNNSLPKGATHRQLVDSNISDNGTTITLGSTTNVSGPLSASNLSSIEITRLQESGSDDRTRIDGLAGETGSYAKLTAANTFSGGKQTNSGSNGFFQSKFPAPGSFGQKDFWIVDSSTSNGLTYPYVHSGFIDFPGFGRQYEDAFITEFYNSGITFDYGSEIAQTGQIISLIANASGSGTAKSALLQLSDDYVAGTKGATLEMQANTIKLGTSQAARYGASNDIQIGSSIGATKVLGDIHLSVGFARQTILSGSVVSPLETVTISSNTASFDFNSSPAKEVTLAAGATTHLDFTSATTGQAMTILVKQPPTGTGSIEMSPNIFEPLNNMYTSSAVTNAQDILTVTSFNGSVYVVNSKTMTQ